MIKIFDYEKIYGFLGLILSNNTRFLFFCLFGISFAGDKLEGYLLVFGVPSILSASVALRQRRSDYRDSKISDGKSWNVHYRMRCLCFIFNRIFVHD